MESGGGTEVLVKKRPVGKPSVNSTQISSILPSGHILLKAQYIVGKAVWLEASTQHIIISESIQLYLVIISG